MEAVGGKEFRQHCIEGYILLRVAEIHPVGYLVLVTACNP